MYFSASLLDADSQRSAGPQILKAGIAFIVGAGLACVISGSWPTYESTSMTESASFYGMPTALGKSPMTLRSLPGAGPWQELALAGIRTTNQCERSAAVKAEEYNAAVAKIPQGKNMVVRMEAEFVKAKDIMKAGQLPPFGYWDPVGFGSRVSEGRLLFLREAEIKHGRVCMLATLGLAVGENFHPLLGGADWSGPATQLFPFVKWNFVPLPSFWPLACLQTFAAIAYLEFKVSYPTLDGTAFAGIQDPTTDEAFIAKGNRIPGDLGFDPLGLKPKTEKDLLEIQNKEISNGRLAMLAAAGIVMQEVVTGKKVF